MTKDKEIRVLLDNIRSVHNVGSIFRTADCLGIKKIYCIGTTPVPLDRFKRKRKDFVKVSLGAEESVAWEYSGEAIEDIERLKKEGFKIVAIEQDEKSIKLESLTFGGKTLLIFGNEVEGVSKVLLKHADVIAEIAMKGEKESMNVSVTAGIAMYFLAS